MRKIINGIKDFLSPLWLARKWIWVPALFVVLPVWLVNLMDIETDPLNPPSGLSVASLFSSGEINGLSRLQGISPNLNDLFFERESRRIWVVGDIGIILSSHDMGRSFTQHHLNPELESLTRYELPDHHPYTRRVTREEAPSLRAVWFVDSLQGVVGGAFGAIHFTSDGGRSWSKANSDTRADIRDVYFVNRRTGWAAGDRGTILKTTDGGRNWKAKDSKTDQDLSSISFFDTLRGLAVGEGGIVVTIQSGLKDSLMARYVVGEPDMNPSPHAVQCIGRRNAWIAGNNKAFFTSDGGSNWRRAPTGTSHRMFSLWFVGDEVGFLAGQSGTILKTTNRGKRWCPIRTGTRSWFNALCFVDDKTGFAAGTDGTILRTEDGGETWIPVLRAVDMKSVYFLDHTNGWAVGSNGACLKTVDGGTSWFAQPTGTPDAFESVRFYDGKLGAIVGAGGLMLTTTNGGAQWKTQQLKDRPYLLDIHFLDAERWVVTTGMGSILLSTDAGRNWKNVYSRDSGWLLGLDFLDAGTGFALGTKGILLRTTDSANTWHAIASPAGFSFQAIATTGTKVFLVGDSAAIFFSVDKGLSWSRQDSRLTVPDRLRSIFFLPGQSTYGWIVGDCGVILRTMDGGDYWEQLPIATSARLNHVWFHDTLNGWAVGRIGTILRSSDGGTSWSEPEHERKTATWVCWVLFLVSMVTGVILASQGVERQKAVEGRSRDKSGPSVGETLFLALLIIWLFSPSSLIVGLVIIIGGLLWLVPRHSYILRMRKYLGGRMTIGAALLCLLLAATLVIAHWQYSGDPSISVDRKEGESIAAKEDVLPFPHLVEVAEQRRSLYPILKESRIKTSSSWQLMLASLGMLVIFVPFTLLVERFVRPKPLLPS